MTRDILQFVLYAVVLVAFAIPLGLYMAKVFAGESGFLRWAERPIFALAGIKPEQGQSWSVYALALVAFNAAGFVLLFLILKFQDVLPWNPLRLPGLSGHLAFNTAASSKRRSKTSRGWSVCGPTRATWSRSPRTPPSG